MFPSLATQVSLGHDNMGWTSLFPGMISYLWYMSRWIPVEIQGLESLFKMEYHAQYYLTQSMMSEQGRIKVQDGINSLRVRAELWKMGIIITISQWQFIIREAHSLPRPSWFMMHKLSNAGSVSQSIVVWQKSNITFGIIAWMDHSANGGRDMKACVEK